MFLTTLFPFLGDFLDVDFFTERKLTDEMLFCGFRVAGIVVMAVRGNEDKVGVSG